MLNTKNNSYTVLTVHEDNEETLTTVRELKVRELKVRELKVRELKVREKSGELYFGSLEEFHDYVEANPEGIIKEKVLEEPKFVLDKSEYEHIQDDVEKMAFIQRRYREWTLEQRWLRNPYNRNFPITIESRKHELIGWQGVTGLITKMLDMKDVEVPAYEKYVDPKIIMEAEEAKYLAYVQAIHYEEELVENIPVAYGNCIEPLRLNDDEIFTYKNRGEETDELISPEVTTYLVRGKGSVHTLLKDDLEARYESEVRALEEAATLEAMGLEEHEEWEDHEVDFSSNW